ncbi:hypothetical protein EJB05_16257, partial [Eragrostis curvula]
MSRRSRCFFQRPPSPPPFLPPLFLPPPPPPPFLPPPPPPPFPPSWSPSPSLPLPLPSPQPQGGPLLPRFDELVMTTERQVIEALANDGFESSSLIVGIDFTRSNEWTGEYSFAGRSLHATGDTANPYEETISIIGGTLSAFDDNNMIHCFGFGDASTQDKEVFCFNPDQMPCNGFEQALQRYRNLVPHLQFGGPTSFVPLIEMAMTIVDQSGGRPHVLLIIADGQVTNQDRRTINAIAEASKFPLSIVLVGVGDGPWDMMSELDDNIPARDFDNFQFVNFSEIMSENISQPRNNVGLALAALSKLPQQYKAMMELGILGQRSSVAPGRVALQPPIGSLSAYLDWSESSSRTIADEQNFRLDTSPDPESDMAARAIKTNSCEGQTCECCGSSFTSCPFCRSKIKMRVKLHCQEPADMGVPSLPVSTYHNERLAVDTRLAPIADPLYSHVKFAIVLSQEESGYTDDVYEDCRFCCTSFDMCIVPS